MSSPSILPFPRKLRSLAYTLAILAELHEDSQEHDNREADAVEQQLRLYRGEE